MYCALTIIDVTGGVSRHEVDAPSGVQMGRAFVFGDGCVPDLEQDQAHIFIV